MEEFLIIAACLLINAVLAAYEMAFVAVPRPELRRLARQGNKDAQQLLKLRDIPERTLSVIQIGITLVGATSAAVGGAGAVESIVPYFMNLGLSENLSVPLAILLVVVPITYASVVVGELVPKTLALRNPVKITLRGAKWVFLADRILSPAVDLLEWSTNKLLSIFFPRSRTSVPPPETTVEIDALAQHHQEAVLNLARIERKPIRSILVPWKDVNCVRSQDSLEDVVAVVFASGHTRLPVIDNDHVLGVLHTKEFLAFRETGSKDWQSIIRKILIIKDNMSALSVLRLMQNQHSHMAIVTSFTGERLGIVTLEDISEEIWGDIYDEDDDSRVRKVFAEKAKSRGLFNRSK